MIAPFFLMDHMPCRSRWTGTDISYDEYERIARTPEGAAEIKRFRNDLLVKAHTGELTPEDADAQAVKHSCKPLCIQFEMPKAIPPISVWSPEMVAAWLSEHRLESVLRHHEKFYSGRSIWLKNDNEYRPKRKLPFEKYRRHGHDLVALGKTSLFNEGFNFNGRRFNFSGMGWFKRLQQFLIDGARIKAAAMDLSKGYKVPIEPAEWRFLRFEAGEVDQALLCMPDGTRRYTDVTFLAREIRDCFSRRAGFAQERNNLVGVRRWKANPEKQPRGNKLIMYTILTNEFKDGFPLSFASDSERLETVKKLMGTKFWHDDQDSFKRYLNNLLREYCED